MFQLILIGGLLYWSLSKGKAKKNEAFPRQSNTATRRPYGSNSQSRSSSRTRASSARSFSDDGILSAEEVEAIVRLLKAFRACSNAEQQDFLKTMDASLLAQFNHLQNSVWNMDEHALRDYLVHQGRQGRYPELGAFAQSLHIV